MKWLDKIRQRFVIEEVPSEPLLTWKEYTIDLPEQRTRVLHRGFDFTGRHVATVQGTLYQQGLFEAIAYDTQLGFYVDVESAKEAIEVYSIEVGDVY